jgi:hypothetical protein
VVGEHAWENASPPCSLYCLPLQGERLITSQFFHPVRPQKHAAEFSQIALELQKVPRNETGRCPHRDA